jgi:hypothetical protein
MRARIATRVATRSNWRGIVDPRIKRLYWQLTALCLGAHFAGWAPGIGAVIALTAWQTVHFTVRNRSLHSFEVQVRAGYLALLLLGLAPALSPVHVVQFVGVNALLIADYCPLARMLALAPWNRRVPLTLSLLRWVVMAPPAPGSILDRMPAPDDRPPGIAEQRS